MYREGPPRQAGSGSSCQTLLTDRFWPEADARTSAEMVAASESTQQAGCLTCLVRWVDVGSHAPTRSAFEPEESGMGTVSDSPGRGGSDVKRLLRPRCL